MVRRRAAGRRRRRIRNRDGLGLACGNSFGRPLRLWTLHRADRLCRRAGLRRRRGNLCGRYRLRRRPGRAGPFRRRWRNLGTLHGHPGWRRMHARSTARSAGPFHDRRRRFWTSQRLTGLRRGGDGRNRRRHRNGRRRFHGRCCGRTSLAHVRLHRRHQGEKQQDQGRCQERRERQPPATVGLALAHELDDTFELWFLWVSGVEGWAREGRGRRRHDSEAVHLQPDIDGRLAPTIGRRRNPHSTPSPIHDDLEPFVCVHHRGERGQKIAGANGIAGDDAQTPRLRRLGHPPPFPVPAQPPGSGHQSQGASLPPRLQSGLNPRERDSPYSGPRWSGSPIFSLWRQRCRTPSVDLCRSRRTPAWRRSRIRRTPCPSRRPS